MRPSVVHVWTASSGSGQPPWVWTLASGSGQPVRVQRLVSSGFHRRPWYSMFPWITIPRRVEIIWSTTQGRARLLTHQLPLSPYVVCPIYIYIYIYLFIYLLFLEIFRSFIVILLCSLSSFEALHMAYFGWFCCFECWTSLSINSWIPPLPFTFWKFSSLTSVV